MRVRLRVDRLVDLVAQSNLSQNHWAIKLGISKGHWSAILNGRYPFTSPKTRDRLLEVFGVAFEDLFEVDSGLEGAADASFQAAIADRYLLEKEIGHGGMGTVYLARDLKHGRTVAVKVVSSEAVSGIGIPQFLKETRYAARLQHPNILPLYDSGEAAGSPFYVMPYVAGGSLRHRLQRDARLPADVTARIAADIAQGLQHAHEAQVLHCDVKPENILLAGRGRHLHAYLADFGISRAVHAEFLEWGRRSELDSSAGTPAYVSPEQASGERNLRPTADVYSFGCVVYEMATGRPPFAGTTTMETVAQRFVEEPTDVRTLAPDVTPAMSAAVRRAMSLKPDDRFASAEGFGEAIERGARAPRGAVAHATQRVVATGLAAIRRTVSAIAPTAAWRPLRHLDAAWVEARQAVRSLKRSPGFVATVVATLGLGVGANAAMFEMVDQLLLRPPAFVDDPESVHHLYYESTRSDGTQRLNGSFSFPTFRAVAQDAERADAFETVAAQAWRTQIAELGDRPRKVMIAGVSASYWRLFRMAPALGRFFGPDEDRLPAGNPVAVLGHAFWQTQFGGDPDVLGRSLAVGEKLYTVVGIAPAGFRGLGLRTPQMFVPLTAAGPTFISDEFASRVRTTWLSVYVRPAAGRDPVALEAATRAIHAEQTAFRGEGVTADMAINAVYQPLLDERGPYPSNSTPYVIWLLGMSGVLVLIACANVATLMTGRVLRRGRETAVRAALGVHGGRIILLPLFESLVLAALAGAVAVPIGHASTGWLSRALVPHAAEAMAGLAPRSVGYGMALVLIVGVLAALVPALHVRRTDLTGMLRAGGGQAGRHRSRTQASLPVAQAALSSLLLIGAGLFVRSVIQGANIPFGYDVDRVIFAEAETSGAFDAFETAEESGYTLQALIDAARAVPGVETAVVSSTPPFMNNSLTGLVLPNGEPGPRPPARRSEWSGSGSSLTTGDASYNLSDVTPGYFEAMGTRILRGRALDERDGSGSTPVMVVSESLARIVWPADNPTGHDAVGRCAHIRADSLPCVEVVGIARDIRRGDLRDDVALHIYRPWDQVEPSFRGTLVVRTAGRAEAVREPLRRALQQAVPSSVFIEVQSLDGLLDEQLRSWTVGAKIFGIFGVLALIMAAVGLFSVVAYDVTQRTAEFGVRVAFGAVTRDLIRLVIQKWIRVMTLGVLIGLAAAAFLAGRLEGLLFDISTRDPITFLAVAALLIGSAIAAALWPAIRAGRVDPLTALRIE